MKSVELFVGAGGLGIGVSYAGFAPQLVIERDRWCCDTIRENRNGGVPAVVKWPDPTECDVRTVDFRPYEDRIELVTGGPPCQPFSLGGRHRAYDDERDMWPEAVRAVREIRPKAFLFENVKGLTRASFASYLAYITHQLTYPTITRRRDESWEDHLSRLERHHTGTKHNIDLTYQVVYRVLNAADYGIPQRRERIVFVGFRRDLKIEWSFPEETHSIDSLLWDQTAGRDYWELHRVSKRDRHVSARLMERVSKIQSRPDSNRWLTVRDAIQGLPDPEREPRKALRVHNHRFQPGARSYPGHTGSPLDEPAKALKAGVHGVPGGENMLVRPDGSVRYFSVRESARLQTFPDDFVFHGAWSETMRQLGNAVPVELGAIVAKSVRKHLAFADKAKRTQ